MNFKKLVKSRYSARAFLDKNIDEKTIKKLLEIASFSPSSTNIQPWEVAVVTKDKKDKINQRVLRAFDDGIKGKMEYEYAPDRFKQEYRDRQVALGASLYELLQIKREDKQTRLKQWRKNYNAFDAPVIVYLFLDRSLACGSLIDIGLFIQTFALAATDEGLATCIEASLAQYPQIVKEELQISDEKQLICGIALGYADESEKVNSFKSTRVKVEEFTRLYGF